ncbi:MAG TPA: thiosulfate oxidation carrier protein SoxY [Usitatibacter sp.]|nr:thiosulfate oxidation carrier protein SoxY [Usitatibacter sp.]
MDAQRRRVVRAVGGGSLLFASRLLEAAGPEPAWDSVAFEAHSFADAARAFGRGTPAESRDIALTSPDLAENGAVVPFTVESRVPATAHIALLVEKNPWTLAVSFGIPPGTDPWVTTRVKMAETSRVIALVATADGNLYFTSKQVKVTAGGCGG